MLKKFATCWFVLSVTTVLLWMAGSRCDSVLTQISSPTAAECDLEFCNLQSSHRLVDSPVPPMAHQVRPAAPVIPDGATFIDAAEPVDPDDFSKERFAPPPFRTPFRSSPGDHLRSPAAVPTAFHLPSHADASPLPALRSVLLLL